MPTADPEGSLSRIVEQFVVRHDRGDVSSLDEFIAEQPEPLRAALRERCEGILKLVRVMSTPGAKSAGWRDPIGKRVGDFRIIEELGRGGMGVVYLAEQLSLRRQIALKVLPHHLTLSERHVRRFQNEAKAAAKLEHPGIVRVYAIGKESGVWYIAMEYIEGRTLYEEFQDLQRPLEDRDRETVIPARGQKNRALTIAAIVADIAEALHVAHERGVIHRDIKPQNILIDRDGKPRIVDFGLAKIIDEASISQPGDLAGTASYMSPEQALAKRVPVDHRTDIFSLGVVLYEMLTLKRPFGGTTSAKVLYEITFLNPKPVHSVDPSLPIVIDAICVRALEKNPDHRFPTAEEMALDLRRFAAGEPTKTKQVSLIRKLWRGVVRRRGIATATMLIVAALFVGGMISFRESTTVTIRAPGHAGARVSYELIDTATGRVSSPTYLGVAPLESVSLPIDYYRFIIEVPGLGFAEMSRMLYASEKPLVIEARLRPTSEVTSQGMVLVPGGTFIFGNAEMAPLYNHHEHEESLDEFWIDKTEVSNGEYELFVRETGAERPYFWPVDRSLTPAEKLLPVTAMGYAGAKAYAEWKGKRLPTELEWERAARGKTGWHLPWKAIRAADEVFEGFANIERPSPIMPPISNESTWRDYVKTTVPVVSMKPGWNGLEMYHVLGNAREWTDSVWCRIQDNGDPNPIATFRIAKGGAWDQRPKTTELYRVRGVPTGNALHILIGIRCAKSVRPK